MILEISDWESLKEIGDHLSNFSEYLRTATSPFERMSEMTAFTVAVTVSCAEEEPAEEPVDFLRYWGILNVCEN